MTMSSTAAVQQKFSDANVTHIDNALFTNAPLKHLFDKKFRPKALVFVGRLEYQKNPQRFLEIARAVLSFAGAEWEVHVFGDGSLRSQLESAADHKIVFHGHVENAWDRISGLNAIHLVTSRWEDPGHAIIEGLARQVPTFIEDNGADYLTYYRDVDPNLVVNSDELLERILNAGSPPTKTSSIFFKKHSVENLKLKLREILDTHSF